MTGVCGLAELIRYSPKVWSTKELEAMKRAAQFRMYEAVPSTTTGKRGDETDAEIEKFLPMLQDYLNGMHINTLPSGI